MVFSNIQGIFSRVGLLAPENGLHVLLLADCGFHYRLRLMELRWVLSNDQAQAESGATEVRRLNESVRAAEEDSEALRAVPACVVGLTAERASFNACTKLARRSVTHRLIVLTNWRLLQ